MEMKSIKTLGLRFLAALATVATTAATAGTVTYYHNDLSGSPVAATNAAGQVIWRETYRPYGERTIKPSTDNQVWFTSRRQDADTGLVYMGARYYDPVIGRFVSMDPVGFDDKNIHSHNRYAYANNNPYRYVDPDGMSPAHVLRFTGQGAFWAAGRLGATELGEKVGLALWVLMNASSDSSSEGEKQDSTSGKREPRFPDRKLPRDDHGNPASDGDAEGAHTQLGQREGRHGKHDQAREFDAQGKPVRDVDFTDHGRPSTHPNPHQHRYLPSSTGGTPTRGPTEPLP
jgi:RHS repeat-associated protein